jgi:flagellar hook-associated protein 3 FlgL
MLSSRAMQNLQLVMKNLEKPQSQVTSGKRITNISDDPVDAARIVNLKASLAKQNQYSSNISSTLDWMNTTSSTLESILDILQEVDDLISTLSAPTTSAERANSTVEVDMLLSNLVSTANSKLLGKYIFGGNETLTAPFTAEYSGNQITSVTQNPDGIDATRNVRLNDVDTVEVNVPGDRVFQPNGVGEDGDVFNILAQLRTALENNDSEGMKTVQENLDTAIKRIASDNASLGGTISRLEDLKTRLDDETVLTEEQRSALEDADIAQAAYEYNQAELIYQAALAATSRVIQISLVNFLT